MTDALEQTTLKIKLTEGSVGQFKARSNEQGVSRDEYAAAALHFALQDSGCVDESRNLVSSEPDVYLSLQIPAWLRESLAELGHRTGRNVGAFSGMALGQYFERHQRDPRELFALFHIDVALMGGKGGRLTEAGLEAILERCGSRLLSGVAPAFMANWFFNRFKSRIRELDAGEQRVAFSTAWLTKRFGRMSKAR